MAEKVRKTVRGSPVTDSGGDGEPMEVHVLSREHTRFRPRYKFFSREATGSDGG